MLEYLERYERRVAAGGCRPAERRPAVSATAPRSRCRRPVSRFRIQSSSPPAPPAYGQELDGVVDLDALGGLVTKAVSPEPRAGAPAPRVAEFDGGMINAVGLANPGVAAVRAEHLPWLARDAARRRGSS